MSVKILPWTEVLLLVASLLAQTGSSARASDCRDATIAAEQRHGIPSGLLAAISRVESGDWSWSVNDNGPELGRRFGSREDAERYTQGLLAAGQRMIDVGCFQVDLLYHPDAFPQWRDAFDSERSAEAAAGILSRLHDHTGDWDHAISLYHSADPHRGQPYLHSVMTEWKGLAVAQADPAQWPAEDPYVVITWAAPGGITVWSPGQVRAMGTIVRRRVPGLPQVVTP
ncbi:MAG: hypothetical protein ACRYHQ_39440 [Janthinobacterium lividum]